MEQIKREINTQIDDAYTMSNGEVEDLLDEMVRLNCQENQMSIEEKLDISKSLYYELRGLAQLQPLLENPLITEIMVNGPNNIYIEVGGELQKTDIVFESKEKLEDIVQKIVSSMNRMVNEGSPICDVRLEDGSRVNVVLPPIALEGPILTIRKFSKEMMGIKDLIRLNSVDKKIAGFLEKAVKARYNIFICGGTGSGKTTLLNILSDFIPQDQRVITIEDSAELQLHKVSHKVRLEARNRNTEGIGTISIRDLIVTSLRMRPDRIIVGEVRGKEAIDMLQAMNTGHDGSLSTGHANSIKDMISRLETMILLHDEIPLGAVKKQIASAIDIFVNVSRMKDYSRKVTEIVEVRGFDGHEIQLNSLFKYSEDTGFEEVGVLKHKDKMEKWIKEES